VYRFISCLLSLVGLLPGAPVVSQERNRSILAVFAHADDELVISPLLARYKREGAQVYMVIVTRGEKFAPQTSLPPGEELAKLRSEEARCAARALGIDPPSILAFDDGSLGERIRPPWITLSKVESELRKLFAKLKPDVVITWGPEGGYGHPDHRLVGAVVTQLVQHKTEGVPSRLFYPGFPRRGVSEVLKFYDLPLASTEMEYLTVQVPYSTADLNAAKNSFACYKSQFPKEVLQLGALRLDKEVWQGRIYLRPWFGSAKGEDLFALSP
jgi:LmbE family N-acetylglucosaminyl deacetylase